METGDELVNIHSELLKESQQSPDGPAESVAELQTKETSYYLRMLLFQKGLSSNNDDISSVLSLSTPKLDYKPPCWALEPNVEDGYGIEVIKNGTIVESVDFKNSKSSNHFVIGRLPLCDMTLDHPTISRYHCILQYGEDLMERSGKGWHIYDLGSTHGTKLNKRRIPSKQYIRIRVGYVMQFGGSSRIMVLKGPSSDVEKECEYSPTEMKKMRERRKLEDKLRKEAENEMKEENDKNSNDEGISWGMDYGEEQAYAHADEKDFDDERESAYSDDPLKALSHFFDREGFDMEFTFTESGMGHTHKWTCYIELPVDTAAGQSLSASATCSGGKKEAQTMCALNACRILDMHGVLYGSKSAAKKKAKDLAENDYYDSDEDIYLDRTGQIEKSRENRRRRALEARGEYTEQKETYEGLLKKISSATEEMQQIGKRLESLSNNVGVIKDDNTNEDDLDVFCRNLEKTHNNADSIEVKVEKSHLRQKLVELKHEIERMEKLAKIAKPVALPSLKVGALSDPSQQKQSQSAALMRKLMMLKRSKAKESHQSEDSREVIGMQLPPQLSTDKNKDNQFVVETEDDDATQSVHHIDEPPSTSSIPHSDQAAPTSSQSQPGITDSKSTITSESGRIDSLTVNGQSPKSSTENLNLDSERSSETGYGKVDRVEGRKETNFGAMTETKCISLDQQAPERDSNQPSDEGVGEIVVKRKRMRLRATDRASNKSTSSTQQSGEYGEGCVNRDLDYATWLPPENQSGDGTTALNAKFAGKY
ncbi:unnamed protein product [Anisakis simplex]|uniref:Kanadaptin (inferred by orthology to a human protein) n=1 Tax=Anisakis simplex TaxID=6269 RepID=A0A0M3K7B0_ANISI|nr:unnamed protein product [Anisakis simplex]